MSSIIQRSMGDPIVSQMIQRYPVVSAGSHRLVCVFGQSNLVQVAMTLLGKCIMHLDGIRIPDIMPQ